MSLFDLTGQVAVVTGATKGIGLGVAHQMAAHGARLIVSSRDQGASDALAETLNAEYGRGETIVRGVACDINDLDQIDRLAEAARSTWNQVDTLVCNASLLSYAGDSRTTPHDYFDKLLTTNIHHNFRLCQALRPDIARRGGGAIVLIGSVAGHTASPSTLAYGVSKAGMAHMARSLADEMAPERIRVNCIAPGLIRSFTSARIWQDAPRLDGVEKTIPLGRIGEPDDVAGAVIFLASKAGAYVTGTTVHVDGGRTFLNPPQKFNHLVGLESSNPAAE